jgi:uncharacterized phiE125 gp8 family phage protein
VKNVTTRTYQPTDYVTIAELRAHLRITSNVEDAYLGGLLSTCFGYASNILGYEVCKSTVDYFFKDATDSKFHIPARILSLTSVKYRDIAGDIQTLASSNYDEVLTISANYGYDVTLINAATSLYDYGWRYKVTVVEGFAKSGDTADISKLFPDEIRHGIYLLAEHFYTNRGAEIIGASVSKLDYGHEHLFSNYSIKEFV